MTLLLEVRRARNSTGLPRGPSAPAAAQTLEWALRPTALLRRCARRHGEAFTLRLTFDDAPMVCVWSPQGVAGVHVAPCLYLVGRHPAVWGPDAAAWRPGRWLVPGAPPPEAPHWVPFGGGVRRCVGASFAVLELRAVLRAVLARWTVAPDREPGERMRRRGVTLQPERGARVVLLPA
jgi:cytochrome P450